MKHVVNATIRRLSDEEPDPIENDDASVESGSAMGWASWGPETIRDIQHVIENKLSPQQREIIEALLAGYTYKDLAVTEKYWRHHMGQAIKRIQKELGV